MVKPLGKRVLLEEFGKKMEEVGGIVLPDSVQERQQLQTKVVALGNAKNEDGKAFNFDVAVGDVVVTKKFSGVDVDCNDKKYKIVDQEEILAILEQ
jgi:chaperonin GroES